MSEPDDTYDATAHAEAIHEAAPDLYAALVNLWEWVTEGRSFTTTDPVPDELGAQVIAALGKADSR